MPSSARLLSDSSLQANINVEATARLSSDSSLQANLNLEATTRLASDSSLQASLNLETTARLNSDSTLTANLSSEITARMTADSSIQANLNVETTSRINSDVTLQANLDGETSARLSEDTSLQTAIDLETSSRLNSDSSLQANLDIETTARLNSDSSLQALINAFDAAVVDVPFTAAAGGINTGDVVALSETATGEVIRANATSILTCETVAGVATQTKSAGQTVLVRTFGVATVTTDGTNLDVGKRVYVSTTAGQASRTAPSYEFNVVYLLGNSQDINKVFVNPSLEYAVEGVVTVDVPANNDLIIYANTEDTSPAT